MTSQNKQWQDVKENYLKLIEKKLAQIDHSRRAEILENVREHLDNKYAELSPEQQTWENFQQIITEMGPPEEYAELLTENNIPTVKTTSGVNTFLAILFVAVLAAVGSYLIYSAKTSNQPTGDPVIFVNDLPVNGIAIKKANCTADFVQSLLGSPKRIDSGGKMLRYTDHGFDLWFSGNGPLSEIHLNRGFKGKLDTGISMDSTQQDVFRKYGKPTMTVQTDNLHRKNDDRFLYQKGNISRIYYGDHGLIFWFQDDAINQIVPFKGYMENPDLSAESSAQPFEFEMDERVLGKWVSVDFVRKIEFFIPEEKQWTGDLYLKGLTFYKDGTTSGPWTWTKGWLWHPGDKTKAHYQIKNMQGADYLFMEWMSGDVTIRGQKPWYYVLKRADEKRLNNTTANSLQNYHKTVQGDTLPVSGKITFIRWRSLKQPDCVEQVNLANGEIKSVVQASPERSSIRSFCFSPDKKQFLFEMGSGVNWYENNEIYIGNSVGENIRQVTNNKVYDGDPAWSLDGKQMAFTRGWGINGRVYLRDLESGEEQPLSIPELIISRNPHWLTEDSLLVVGFDTDKHQGLVDIDLKQNNIRWLLKDKADYLCLSPDRKKLACVVQKRNETPQIIQQIMKENDWIYSVNILTLATTQLKPLNEKQTVFEKDACPLWSHNGEKLAWIRNNALKNNCKLLIYDIKKESTLVIPLADEKAVSLLWAPDDSRIACVSCDQKETKYNLRLFLLPIGTSENIFNSEDRIQCCDWE
ncbi:MAG: HAAS signaling domain-containing protein [Planctomycetota bacterium]|jgi:Tol biopolymer transport system component